MEWNSVTVFFAGSKHALRALLWARTIAQSADIPIRVITHDQAGAARAAEKALKNANLLEELAPHWQVTDAPSFTSLLWEVPRESLVVAGAFGRSGVKAQLLGSRTEAILAHLPNPLFLVGPAAPGPSKS
ncbi:MAG TPA: universal stress protein [Acidobacteria bacterium]|nr:universal stress protein [Acidobacteriota bacterium]